MVKQDDLDLLPLDALISAVIEGQSQTTQAVRAASAAIARAVELMAREFEAGGRWVFVGAGTSGRLAVMQAAELPGTYGVSRDRMLGRVAGGGAGQLVGIDAAEDDEQLGEQEIADLEVRRHDVVICVAASGTTPYTMAAARMAKDQGASVVSVTTVAGSALEAIADVAVVAVVGPEVVSGSTRMAAGTAQKWVLDTLTTAAMVRAGRVHMNHMIDVEPANAKLRERVAGIVAEAAGVEPPDAAAALERCDWNARAAIVHLVAEVEPSVALHRARSHRTVRDALRHDL